MKIWKHHYEALCNMDTEEEVTIHMCGFDGVQRGNYFGGEPIRGTEVEVRVGKLKDGKVARKNEVTGEVVKDG